ncbi:MAG TPA: hypothetical protein VGN42_22560 [Pirellulales bacterium]|jgi:hypothetical protein|nr:hypothetical protein [Pirellulales bacterium]
MTRAKKCPPIIDTVIANSNSWSESTKKTAKIDANVAFEALLAEYGLDETLKAIGNQGLGRPDEYAYVVKPLCDEAKKRRPRKTISD